MIIPSRRTRCFEAARRARRHYRSTCESTRRFFGRKRFTLYLNVIPAPPCRVNFRCSAMLPEFRRTIDRPGRENAEHVDPHVRSVIDGQRLRTNR